jgi:hypothetical protein
LYFPSYIRAVLSVSISVAKYLSCCKCSVVRVVCMLRALLDFQKEGLRGATAAAVTMVAAGGRHVPCCMRQRRLPHGRLGLLRRCAALPAHRPGLFTTQSGSSRQARRLQVSDLNCALRVRCKQVCVASRVGSRLAGIAKPKRAKLALPMVWSVQGVSQRVCVAADVRRDGCHGCPRP